MWKLMSLSLCINQQNKPPNILFVGRRQDECLIISCFGSAVIPLRLENLEL